MSILLHSPRLLYLLLDLAAQSHLTLLVLPLSLLVE
jgi:hypothetical protein